MSFDSKTARLNLEVQGFRVGLLAILRTIIRLEVTLLKDILMYNLNMKGSANIGRSTARALKESSGSMPISYLVKIVGASSRDVKSLLKRLENEGVVIIEGDTVRLSRK